MAVGCDEPWQGVADKVVKRFSLQVIAYPKLKQIRHQYDDCRRLL
jgi:hypothetical protein